MMNFLIASLIAFLLSSVVGAQSSTASSDDASSTPISDSVAIRFTIGSGQTHKYQMSDISDGSELFITLNTCNEPFKSAPFDLLPNQTALSLYGSDTNLTDSSMLHSQSDLGYAELTLDNLQSSNAFIDIVAPKLPSGLQSSSWTYQLGVSTKNLTNSYLSSSHMFLVDTDFSDALFVTDNFTVDSHGNVNDSISNYNVFVYPAKSSPTSDIRRLSRSFCGITTAGALIDQNNAQLSNTTRGEGDRLKGQIFITGLNKSENYLAFLTNPSQGLVYKGVGFTTKSDTNCQVIFDLKFCSGVAFAVPGNASAFTTTELRDFYDQAAQDRYGNFSKSLENIPCNASKDTQYSLMKNCDDCANSYKQWLCAITIPRCEDFSNKASFLHPRLVGHSRNPLIDEIIKPGNYKEILPCDFLCSDLVRDCPSDFQFICPKPGRNLELSYGKYVEDGNVTCSYPGAVYYESGSNLVRVGNCFIMLILFWLLLL